jgi:hypothetical protein
MSPFELSSDDFFPVDGHGGNRHVNGEGEGGGSEADAGVVQLRPQDELRRGKEGYPPMERSSGGETEVLEDACAGAQEEGSSDAARGGGGRGAR